MRAGLSHVSAGLLRAIRARAGGLPAGEGGEGGEPLLVIEDFGETPWASLTFSGLRHSVDIRLEGDRGAVLALAQEMADWDDAACTGLAGHFLADLQTSETGRVERDGGRMSLSLRLDALTIEE
jgi:hypothetical protein